MDVVEETGCYNYTASEFGVVNFGGVGGEMGVDLVNIMVEVHEVVGDGIVCGNNYQGVIVFETKAKMMDRRSCRVGMGVVLGLCSP